MPLLKLTTSVALGEKQCKEILPALSQLVAECTGKPEAYVMVVFAPAAMMMAGKEGPAAFVDFRAIGGLSEKKNKEISARVCSFLSASLGIPAERVYIAFTEVSAGNWGWNGDTF
jgi:phenylpyruvate tautomerase PptA (4-oxalocrotonate tautomerase family)